MHKGLDPQAALLLGMVLSYQPYPPQGGVKKGTGAGTLPLGQAGFTNEAGRGGNDPTHPSGRGENDPSGGYARTASHMKPVGIQIPYPVSNSRPRWTPPKVGVTLLWVVDGVS